MVHRTRTFLEERDFSVGVCTGTDKSGLNPFREGKLDILIGSRTVSTGVDGLQNVCNNVILLSPPWTGADEKQIEGRVVRQGSDFDRVTMAWPQIVVDLGSGLWNWDKQRRDIIQFKHTLSDCALDGTVLKALSLSKQYLLSRARDELEKLIARLEEEGYASHERPILQVPLLPELKERARVKHGDFTKINTRWINSNSSTIHERLKADPSEWYLYHTLYWEAREGWDEVPAEPIATKLRARPDLRVGDFGCGECLLRDALPDHSVRGFDYVAIDETVTACDMAHTPLDDSSLDAAVFSLSLMGNNWTDYLTEASRVLQPLGYLFVAEPAKRWKEGVLEQAIEEAGFGVVDTNQRGAFRYVVAVKSL
jgi:hypothetical protein